MKKLVCVDIGIVLLEQEDIICGSGEDLPPNGHRCPPWLEPEVVCVHGVPTSETVHTMKLQPLPMAQIKSGKKTIELRLYDEKRQRVSEGDRIRFVNMQDAADQITVTVEALYVFDSFAELYAHLPLTACGYDEDTLAQASPRDMEQYYSAEEQSRFGVVGIKIRL